MYRALVCDLLEACALFLGEWAAKRYSAFDPVNETFLVLRALRTVFHVNSTLSQTNGHVLEWPLLASRVKRHGHRHATAQRREQ